MFSKKIARTDGSHRPLASDSQDEDPKGARRMPWHRKSTKDAASCDKLRGGANGLRSGDLRMGEPTWGHARVPAPEHIGREEATRGTETSKYPEEEKSTEIARVAASESAPAQTHACVSLRALLHAVLRDRTSQGPQTLGGVTKGRGSGTAWKGRPERATAPYAKPRPLRVRHPSSAGHVKPGANLGGPPSKAEHSPVTDSEPVP